MPLKIITASHEKEASPAGVRVELECPAAEIAALHQRAHDLSSALLRLGTAIKMIEQGFDFNSRDGKPYLEQLKEAHALLKDESGTLLQIYRGLK